MIERYKYTKKEIEEILKSIVVLVDSREQKNQKIIDFFDKKKIKYKVKKLDQGDYSFYIPENEELNIDRAIYFDKEVVIERKNSTDEIIGNFASDRNRIEDEFMRFKGKMYLLIEDVNFYENMNNEKYISNYGRKAALGTWHSFIDRYDIRPYFINNELSGVVIYLTFYYYLKNLIK